MRLTDIIKNPLKIIFHFGMHGRFRFLSDEKFLKIMYYCKFNKKLDLDNPKTFNEKMQWLKLHNRKPEYTKMVDKYEAKQYAGSLLGTDIIIPTLAIWDSCEEIDIAVLPEQFVMKCTHDSHTVFICRDKNNFDLKGAIRKIKKAMKRNYYWVGREYPYKDVKPRIIVEKYLENNTTDNLLDYKFYMFGGKLKIINVTERYNHQAAIDYYDSNFCHIDLSWSYPCSGKKRNKPNTFKKMIDIAEKISIGIPFIRVDMYEVDNKVFLGELTFFDGNGFDGIEPHSWDLQLGDWIDLKSI